MNLTIKFSNKKEKVKPKIGDIKITKLHGIQIRVPRMYDGCFVVSGSKQLYDWKTKKEIIEDNRWASLLQRKEIREFIEKNENN